MGETAPQPGALTIRPATSRDWEIVAELHAGSWRSAYRGILSDAYLDRAVEDRRTLWSERFTEPLDPSRVVVLAESPADPGALGFCCIQFGQDPVWGSLIDNLHVRPDMKRQRIGPRLLAAAIRLAPPGFDAIPMHLTVFETNHRAIAAYESWGGRLVERPTKVEPDGAVHELRRYAWDSPGALLALLSGGVG